MSYSVRNWEQPSSTWRTSNKRKIVTILVEGIVDRIVTKTVEDRARTEAGLKGTSSIEEACQRLEQGTKRISSKLN